MSADDEKHYVTSVYTGRYKSQGRIKNTKKFVDSKESQEKHYNLIKRNRKYRLITKPKKLYFSVY
ncbi:MAG: hypothetical protein Q4P17_08845 [Methanobacterium sp.]|nr:hypothetical protein [Methanobacterium sp.]